MAESNVPDDYAALRLRTFEVTPSDPRVPAFLLVEVHVDCAVCGQTTMQIHGHHVAALAECLRLVLRDHPGLCGQGVEEVGAVTAWRGTSDPRKTGQN